jgi:hypothetical protein
MGILQMLQRRKSRNAFQKYVSTETIARLLRETDSGIKPPEVKHFQFVVILADDTNPQELPSMISNVMSTLVQHRANITNITSSLFVALLGVPFPENNSAQARRELVDALLRENGNRIRVVHGECDGPFGMFGGGGRLSYGGLIPGFSAALKKLLHAEFGTAVEIAASST